MRILRTGSSLVPTVALALTIVSRLSLSAQTAGEDVHNARTEKHAAKGTRHAVKHLTEKLVIKAKEGTTVAADKTRETSVKAYDRSKEGVQKAVHSDAQRKTNAEDRSRETTMILEDKLKREKQRVEDAKPQ